jgi:hypothetical protein
LFACSWVFNILYVSWILIPYERNHLNFFLLERLCLHCWLLLMLYRSFLVNKIPFAYFGHYFLCFKTLIKNINAYTNVLQVFSMFSSGSFIVYVLNLDLWSILSAFSHLIKD